MARFDLKDFEWSVIAPLLPNKMRGVKRVDDRRVLNGIFWRLRTGAPWADIPERYGPHTTCVNRFNRWRRAGVWDRILQAVSKAYNGTLQMIDSSSIRVHQHAANGPVALAPTSSSCPTGSTCRPSTNGSIASAISSSASLVTVRAPLILGPLVRSHVRREPSVPFAGQRPCALRREHAPLPFAFGADVGDARLNLA